MKIPLTIALLTLVDSIVSTPQRHNVGDNRHLQQSTNSFRPTTVSYTDFNYEDDSTALSQTLHARPFSFADDNYPIRNAIPLQPRPQAKPQPQVQQAGRRPASPPQQFKQQIDDESREDNLEDKEEEPDRLTLLLPQSKFDCVAKNTGYYADEGLACEVFHYCQDNVKHSWICPEGFTFHQVHLICMPPGNDNICDQSSKYHFVNEYLYKPVNLEEHQTKPNVSLRYSERFYPNQYYPQDYDSEEEEELPQKQAVRVQQAPAQHRIVPNQRRPVPTQFGHTLRPETTLSQVFRSPEEVNISLQQRRPPYLTKRYVTSQNEEEED